MSHQTSKIDETVLAIDIKNLNKTYASGVQAIKKMDLEVPQGSFFALLGANGAGKTTTIGIITDLVRKTSGTVKIFGIDIDTHFSDAKFHIGVVPQEFNFSFFETVLNIVATQGGYYGIPLRKAKKDAREILQRLGLGDKLNTIARELSGGMKRRLMIARALIHKPKLLILDEPTAGVDAQLRIGMWNYLEKINQEHNVTILLTTHYLEEVEQLCESAAIIKDGEIIKLDTVKSLLASLEKEPYTIDIINNNSYTVTQLHTLLHTSNFSIQVVDDSIIEVLIDNTKYTLSNLVEYLKEKDIYIKSIRPKSNRLESLFLNIINQEKKT